jgi:phosphatidylglycerophosphate synthase
MIADTWSRQLARPLMRPLVGTRVTPNHVTTLRLATGVAAAAAFAVGSAGWAMAGGALIVLSIFLDSADGELARLADACSALGDDYDVAADIAVTMLLFVGLGVGLRGGPLGWWALPVGLLTCAAVGAIYWVIIKIERLEVVPVPVLTGGAGFAADESLYLVGPIAWLGWQQPFLLLSFLGAPLFAAWLWLRYRRLRGSRYN